MARPRDEEFEQVVLAWHFKNGEVIKQTAEHFAIHRTTLGRWLAEFNDTSDYARERFYQETSMRKREYSVTFDWVDYKRLQEVEKRWDMSLEDVIIKILEIKMEGESNE